jgi:hypothetical protein
VIPTLTTLRHLNHFDLRDPQTSEVDGLAISVDMDGELTNPYAADGLTDLQVHLVLRLIESR